jgi:hypothetical protein
MAMQHSFIDGNAAQLNRWQYSTALLMTMQHSYIDGNAAQLYRWQYSTAL